MLDICPVCDPFNIIVLLEVDPLPPNTREIVLLEEDCALS